MHAAWRNLRSFRRLSGRVSDCGQLFEPVNGGAVRSEVVIPQK